MVQFPFNWINIWGMCSWALIGCIWMCAGKRFWCWLCNPKWWWHPYSEHPDGRLPVPRTAATPWGCSHGNDPWTCQKMPHCPRPQWTLVRNAERKESEWNFFQSFCIFFFTTDTDLASEAPSSSTLSPHTGWAGPCHYLAGTVTAERRRH